MSAGDSIRGALAADAAVVALVATRIFPNLMPQATAFPVVVYQVISDIPENSLTGAADKRIREVRVQIDSYSRTYSEAHAVADAVDQVISSLGSSDLSAWRSSSRDLYDNEAQLHRVSADYSVWL